MEKKWIQIHPSDKVAVALTPLAKGEKIELADRTIELQEDIAQGHKFALVPMSEGETVIKYGQPIGRLTAPVRLVNGCTFII